MLLGGIPKGNPDHIESSSASKYSEYSLEGFTDLTAETTKQLMVDTTQSANEDADRVLPVIVMRESVKGVQRSLHENLYTTVVTHGS